MRPDELSYAVIKIQATKVRFFHHPYIVAIAHLCTFYLFNNEIEGFLILSCRTNRPVLSLLKSWESLQSLGINQPVPAAKEMTFWP